MDWNFARPLSGLVGIVLALACRGACAAEAIVSDQEPSAMVLVTASDGPDDVQAPPAAPSDLVVRPAARETRRDASAGELAEASDAVAATITLSDDLVPGELQDAPASPSKLTVIANQRRPAPLTALATDPAVVPASSVEAVIDGHFYAEGPFGCEEDSLDEDDAGPVYYPAPHHYASGEGVPMRERLHRLGASMTSGRQPTQLAQRANVPRPATRPAAERTTRQLAANSSRRSAKAPSQAVEHPSSAKAQLASNASPQDLLVQAHELSQTAASEAQYAQIIEGCSRALKRGLEGENRAYAENLSAWALNRRGQLRADEGQKDLALADFEAALAADPNCWRALHNRGVTFAQGGQFAEAFDDICRVIELNPKFAKAYSNRATLYMQANDVENAVADYDQALQLDPELTPALVGRGRVRHMQGHLSEALADLTSAVKCAPDDAEIVCSRADLLTDLGRYSKAVEDYARAIDLNPRFEHAFRNGAWLLATCPDDSVRDVDAALTGAQAALNCGYGERHAALDTMAAALANAGRYEEAVGTIQQAIDVAPDELHAIYEARQQLYESGRPFRTRPVENADVQRAEYTEE